MNISVPYKITSSDQVVPVFEQVFADSTKKNQKIFLSQQIKTDLKTAFVEAIANAIAHAQELKKYNEVKGQFFLNDRAIGFNVIDHGKGFNIDKVPIPNFNKLKSSGRGVFMIKQLGDDVTYRKGKKHNLFSFKRNLINSGSMRELDLINDISEAILSEASLEEVCQITLDQALEIFHVSRASILVYDEKIKRLKIMASRGISLEVQKKILIKSGEGISGQVFQHGKPLLIEDINVNRHGIKKQKYYKSGSFLSVPLITSPLRLNEKPWGVINLTERKDGKKFTKKDLKLLSTIANQAMMCLHMRFLLDEVKKTEGLKQQLEVARNIQNSYLPMQAPKLARCDIAGLCEMAESVGGDYFDFIQKGYWLYLVIADVSGHDLGSTMTMVNFRSQLRAFLNFESDPGKVLTLLNQSLYEDLQASQQFVSCLLVKFDTQIGKFELANAGHNPPLFFEKHLTLTKSGVVLGINADEIYQNQKGFVAEGNHLILYTDGVVEAMNEDGQFFGIGRLKEIIQAHQGSSQDLVQKIIQTVTDFRSPQRSLDDLTAVALRFV